MTAALGVDRHTASALQLDYCGTHLIHEAQITPTCRTVGVNSNSNIAPMANNRARHAAGGPSCPTAFCHIEVGNPQNHTGVWQKDETYLYDPQTGSCWLLDYSEGKEPDLTHPEFTVVGVVGEDGTITDLNSNPEGKHLVLNRDGFRITLPTVIKQIH